MNSYRYLVQYTSSPKSQRSSPSTGTHTGILGIVHLIIVTEELTFNRNSYRYLVQYTSLPKSQKSSPSTGTHTGTWYSTPHHQIHREAHLQQELIQVLGTVHLIAKFTEKLTFNRNSYRYLVQYTSLPKSQ
jgi:hypothetical protein